MFEDAQEAHASAQPVRGHLGVSVVMAAGFNPALGNAADAMHLLLNVGKAMIKSAFGDGTNRPGQQLSTRLVQQHGTSEFSWQPRALQATWKASELQNFVLFFAVLLDGLHTPLGIIHHMLLASSFWLCMQDGVPRHQLPVVRAMLRMAHRLAVHVHGVDFYTMNTHCVTHLADYVESHGPLWSTSMWSFERYVMDLMEFDWE